MSANRLLDRVVGVPAGDPQDINGAGLDGAWQSMKLVRETTVLINLGALANAMNLTLQQATDVSGTDAKALSFTEVAVSSADNAQVDTIVAVAADSHAVADDDDGKLILVSIKSEDLDKDNDFDCIRARLSDPGGVNFVSMSYLSQQARYLGSAVDHPDTLVD